MKLRQGIPRHEQISNWLREHIEAGRWKVDEKLPSENELTEKFDVSRVTVRRALQTLENEQLIYRSQGLGSFVKDHRSHQSFVRLRDFVEEMKRAGMEASSQVLVLRPETVPSPVASRLQVEEDAKVLRLDRLRLGDGRPVAFDITWLPMFYGQLIEGCDLEEETIYGILEREYEIPVEKGYYRIEAENADDYLAEHLQVDPGGALLLIDRLSLSVGDKPIYYQKRYYRTDRIVYELMVQRQPGAEPGEGEQPLPLREFLPVFSGQEKT
ncbi:MAG: GntR family transcriptional regulator [Balneolaceae bacterium]|nr:GntR family transcriptional regulator [Balneolaceae bacterium]